uniref:RNA pseudouridylate synthase domain-containing protein 4 n=1 Tax=Cacopsylla melanoneura TaxID=428564 RepID=A0A8D8LLZ4_9HEMI
MQLNKVSSLFMSNSWCLKCSSRNFQNGFSPTHKIDCLEDLVSALERSTIFFDKHLLVLNKPYGLKKQLPVDFSPSPPTFVKLNSAAASLEEYSLQDALPFLCDIFKVPKLTVVKSPDRYMSGVTVLAATDKAVDLFTKCIRRARASLIFPTYQAVCVGTPNVKDETHTLGVVMETRKEHRALIDRFKEKKIVFVNTWSKNDIKRADIALLRIHHKVLASTPDECASLIQVSSNWNRAHCVRTFLAAQLLTPVLGDHVCSSRVKYVFDKPVRGDVWNVDHTMQYLPTKLKEKLKVKRKNEELTIPEHIHLSRLVLPAYYKDKQSLVLESDIATSSAFQYALNTLGLLTREQNQAEKDEEAAQSSG